MEEDEEEEDDEQEVQDEDVYCFCNQGSYGEMVACDGEGCPREWFHLECVGLRVAPEPNGEFIPSLCFAPSPWLFYPFSLVVLLRLAPCPLGCVCEARVGEGWWW